MAGTPVAIGLVLLILLGLNTGRSCLSRATPALAGLIALGSLMALLGFRVFRNRMRSLRVRYHGSRRTRALLAPPLAAPRPARPLLLSRIRRTRFKRPVAGIGVAHVFVHSRRAKTLGPQQALARFCRWRECNSLPSNRQILFAGNLLRPARLPEWAIALKNASRKNLDLPLDRPAKYGRRRPRNASGTSPQPLGGQPPGVSTKLLDQPLGNRLTVDPRTLTPLVLVRIQVPQPLSLLNFNKLRDFRQRLESPHAVPPHGFKRCRPIFAEKPILSFFADESRIIYKRGSVSGRYTEV